MVKIFYASGEKDSETEWRDGAVVGGSKWYESGALKDKGAAQDGMYESWYESGQLMQRGELAGGLRTGAWAFFREDGSPDQATSGQYTAGERTGSL